MRTQEIIWLDPKEINEDRENVRRAGDDSDLAGLAVTIREYGVLQPLGVKRQNGNGNFTLVYGMRRRRAAIMASQPLVPCVEVSLEGFEDGLEGSVPQPGRDRLTLQLLENLQRRDLNDLEKADGFAGLRLSLKNTRPGLRDSSLDDLTAQTLGLSVRTVQRYLGLRELAESVREIIASGGLTVTQAQHLRAITDETKQADLAKLAVERGLSAATISKACNNLTRSPNLAVEEALLAAQRGEEAPEAKARARSIETVKAPRAPKVVADSESDADLWDENDADSSDDEGNFGQKRAPDDSATANGNRVFRFRTVDAFCDEVARLARAIGDGDLARTAESDPEAAMKIKLAKRQIDYIAREVGNFCKAKGWS